LPENQAVLSSSGETDGRKGSATIFKIALGGNAELGTVEHFSPRGLVRHQGLKRLDAAH
jgi:hypothetical protein